MSCVKILTVMGARMSSPRFLVGLEVCHQREEEEEEVFIPLWGSIKLMGQCYASQRVFFAYAFISDTSLCIRNGCRNARLEVHPVVDHKVHCSREGFCVSIGGFFFETTALQRL